MAMVVKNNMQALNTLNTLNSNTNALTNSLKKVSSGMKINGAADDASGYAISERMRVQIRSLDQAKANTQNGSSMMKTAEGAVSSTVEILKTLKEKCINAANDSNTDDDRKTIQKELNQSIDQIDDNANVTFNGKYLVDGSKNTVGKATYTVLTNENLADDTTAGTKLTELCSRSGDSLRITDTDKVTVSYVQAGKTYTATFDVDADTTVQDIFTKAEQIDETSKIFADATNESVMKAMGVADAAAALTAMETANNELYGATTQPNFTVKAGEAGSAEALIDAKAGGAAKTLFDEVTNDVVKAIAAYNKDVTAAGNADKAIDMSALKDYWTTTDAADPTKYALAASVDTVLEKADFMKALDNDANYQNMLNQAAGTNFTSDVKTNLTDATKAYNGDGGGTLAASYVGKKNAFDNAHVALVSSSIIGQAASGAAVTTANGVSKGLTITANKEGIDGQIAGLSISITDKEGNVKKSANAALDAFGEAIRAQNKSADNAISLQVGAKANQSIKVGLTDMRSEALGLKGADGTKLNIATQANANAAITVLDNALQKALDQQTTIGAVEARLEYTAANLTTASENVTASESTIRDADMAKEMTEYTKNNVLMQAAQSMLAQANQNSSNVLSLLQ